VWDIVFVPRLSIEYLREKRRSGMASEEGMYNNTSASRKEQDNSQNKTLKEKNLARGR